MFKNMNKAGNSSRSFVEYLAVLLIVVIPLSVQAGLLLRHDSASLGNVSVETTSSTNLAVDTPLLSALQNPNPQGGRGGAEVVVVDGVLVSSGPIGKDVISSTKTATGEISVYTVRSGDTLSHIAEMYGVTANTILWANDLSKATSIQAGQTLIILPIAGVQHVVKKGDTVSALAKKYDGNEDEIIKYNQLVKEEGLVVGSTIVIPGGEIIAPVSKIATNSNKATGGALGNWLSHPASGAVKTQGLHGYNAIDFAGGAGTNIRAAAAGQVIVSKSSGWNGGYGQYIVIKHSNGAQTLYAHLSKNSVGVGASVNQGEVIGVMGNTGRSTGTHLHFEVRGAKNPF